MSDLFTRLGNTTCISRPQDRPSLSQAEDAGPLRTISAAHPTHVVVFGWMDAPLRLVAKYAQPYASLFPRSTILIKLSDGKSYLANETVRRQQLQTVIDEITTKSETKSGDDSDADTSARGVVIHSFSDGGAGNLALFLEQMPKDSPPVRSLIMDSSPGKSNPKTGATAFTMHLANRPALRAVVRFFVWLTLWSLKIWTAVKGDLPRGEKMRRRLNALQSWQWVTAAPRKLPPRMYMYTKSDKLIPWQFVEEHARDLADVVQPGTPPRLIEMESTKQQHDLSNTPMTVELRRWDTPAHCSIARTDFAGYWTTISQFYQSVLK